MDATVAHAANFRSAARLAAIGVSEILTSGVPTVGLKRRGQPAIALDYAASHENLRDACERIVAGCGGRA